MRGTVARIKSARWRHVIGISFITRREIAPAEIAERQTSDSLKVLGSLKIYHLPLVLWHASIGFAAATSPQLHPSFKQHDRIGAA
ncbi:MAG: hypothetical protein DLM68_04910 [Hyphomicrobiales bacterium]|nr:MAG: hypothetical protein DLM68_04910 [Hyphomicrobiales bacterium]